MTEVERVARAMEAEYDGTMESLARWHLADKRAAVRRARGRTVGTVCVNVAEGTLCGKRFHFEQPKDVVGYRLARVVLVPRRRKGGKRG